MDWHKMYKILQKAQDTYGFANQTSVAAEECCELAMVLNKYIRYPDHQAASEALRSRIVEEVADVCIILQHLHMIFGITDQELEAQMWAKLERLERWLDSGDKTLYTSTIDREVSVDETETV